MPDAASFNNRHLEAIWGPNPRDPITGMTGGDKAHLLGRGGKHNRKIMCSPLNFYPLPRCIHSGGMRDHRYFRALLLEIADEKVRAAVRDGRYNMNDRDAAFLEYRYQWYLSAFPQVA